MSWFLGVFGNLSNLDIASIERLHQQPIHLSKGVSHYISSGGIKETCQSGKTENGEWFVCGLGLDRSANRTHFIESSEWENLISKNGSQLQQIDGHFIAVYLKHNSVEIHTDPLGLRDLYWVKCNGYDVFTTRLDWATRFVKKPQINLSALGEKWNLINQFSHRSLISGITRIVSSGKIVLTSLGVTISKTNWSPISDFNDSSEISEHLKSLTILALNEQRNLTLSLSGGLDSRFLLSILLESGEKNFDAHTFGSTAHPDSVLSRAICQRLKIKHTTYDKPIPSEDDCIHALCSYSAYSTLSHPASTVLQLRYYPELYKPNTVLIDGGFGEIWRREFLNRVLIQGKSALINRDIENIIPFLKHSRADLFNSDVIGEMDAGIKSGVGSVIADMPVIESGNIENWIDLLAVRTRLINFYGAEQARLDEIIVAYMPFAQQSILSKVFRLDVNQKKDGKLFKNGIRKNCLALTNYPLAKNGTTIPFSFGMIESRLLAKVKSKFNLCYHDMTTDLFLAKCKTFICDTASSASVKNFEMYDQKKVADLISRYFKGQKSLSSQVDWWLSFEIWRQQHLLKDVF